MNGSASGGWECRCEAGWYGEDCSVPIELNCSDKTDNDGGKSFNLQQRIIFSSILEFGGTSPKISICEAPVTWSEPVLFRWFLPACCLADFLHTASKISSVMKKAMSYVKSELFSGLKLTNFDQYNCAFFYVTYRRSGGLRRPRVLLEWILQKKPVLLLSTRSQVQVGDQVHSVSQLESCCS